MPFSGYPVSESSLLQRQNILREVTGKSRLCSSSGNPRDCNHFHWVPEGTKGVSGEQRLLSHFPDEETETWRNKTISSLRWEKAKPHFLTPYCVFSSESFKGHSKQFVSEKISIHCLPCSYLWGNPGYVGSLWSLLKHIHA